MTLDHARTHICDETADLRIKAGREDIERLLDALSL
jgi:hypothetical protein